MLNNDYMKNKMVKITSKTSLLLLVGLATILASRTGQAAIDTWTGNTSSDWSTGSNWSLGSAPASGDQARFGYSTRSTPTLGAGLFTVQEMYWYFSGAKTSYNITGAGSANTTLKIDPNTTTTATFIRNVAVTGASDQTFSNLTLLLEDSNLEGQTKIQPGDGGSITIASNAKLQIGSTTAQSVILESNGSGTGSGALNVNGVLTAGVSGSSIKVDTGGVLNLNLAAGSSLANIQLYTGTNGVINFFGGGNLGGSVNPSAGRVNLATSGITIGSTTSFAFGTAGIAGNSTIGATYTTGTSTIEGQVGLTGGGGAVRNNIFDVAGEGTLIMSGLLTGGNTASTSVSKTGTGTLSLTRSAGNSISGSAFNVSAGTLLVNNTAGSATGSTVPVNVAVGATLGGAGRIAGATTISGILAPGNSIGTLTVANDVTWNGGSLLGGATTDWKFELGAGNAADLLQITGAESEFIKGTGTIFRFDFLGSTDTGTFKLVDWDSIASVGGGELGTNFAATDFTYTNLGGGNSGTFQFNGSQLEFQAVPEPSSLVMLIGGGVCLILVRRFGRTAV
jgi:fibronectin-binding autotransporter adhesin